MNICSVYIYRMGKQKATWQLGVQKNFNHPTVTGGLDRYMLANISWTECFQYIVTLPKSNMLAPENRAKPKRKVVFPPGAILVFVSVRNIDQCRSFFTFFNMP